MTRVAALMGCCAPWWTRQGVAPGPSPALDTMRLEPSPTMRCPLEARSDVALPVGLRQEAYQLRRCLIEPESRLRAFWRRCRIWRKGKAEAGPPSEVRRALASFHLIGLAMPRQAPAGEDAGALADRRWGRWSREMVVSLSPAERARCRQRVAQCLREVSRTQCHAEAERDRHGPSAGHERARQHWIATRRALLPVWVEV